MFNNGRGDSFEQTWLPFIQGCFAPSFVEIAPVVLEKKIFKVRQCILAISLNPGIVCAKSGLNWPNGSKEEFFSNVVSVLFTISILSPLGKGWGTSFGPTSIPFTQGCFAQSLILIGLVVLEKKIFKISLMYFHYFVIISHGKRRGPSFQQT